MYTHFTRRKMAEDRCRRWGLIPNSATSWRIDLVSRQLTREDRTTKGTLVFLPKHTHAFHREAAVMVCSCPTMLPAATPQSAVHGTHRRAYSGTKPIRLGCSCQRCLGMASRSTSKRAPNPYTRVYFSDAFSADWCACVPRLSWYAVGNDHAPPSDRQHDEHNFPKSGPATQDLWGTPQAWGST